ncbi:MAG: hypothetical protein HQM08_21930 [Candidatus Riflebacteria bacterium]|nr:hypothetical protein [Candidatus Riflebacteria bacterium]
MAGCPECGSSNNNDTGFCGSCGSQLSTSKAESFAIRLMLGTPALLIGLGIAVFADLGHPDPINRGIDFGIFLSLLFMIFAGGYWICIKSATQPIGPFSSWMGGIFGVLLYCASGALSYPLFEYIGRDKLDALEFSAETTFRHGLILTVFFPNFLLGAFSIASRDRKLALRKAIGFFERFTAIGTIIFVIVLTIFISNQLPFEEKKFAFGKMFFDLECREKALSFLEEALRRNSNYHPALYLRGMISLGNSSEKNHEKFFQAREDLQKALTLQPKNALYLVSLSVAEEQALNFVGALKLASQAASLRPDEPVILARMADLSSKMDLQEQTIETYKKMIQSDPENPLILNNLAYSLLEMDKDLPMALNMARKAVNLRPDLPFTLDTLAWAEFKNGSINEALENISEARALASGTLEMDFHYILIASQAGVLKNAGKEMEALLKRPEILQNPKLEGMIRSQIKKEFKNESKNLDSNVTSTPEKSK